MKRQEQEWENLNMLYAGDIRTPADCVMQDSDYQALCRNSASEVSVMEKLDAGMKAEFDTLMEHYLELTYLERRNVQSWIPFGRRDYVRGVQ